MEVTEVRDLGQRGRPETERAVLVVATVVDRRKVLLGSSSSVGCWRAGEMAGVALTRLGKKRVS